MHNDYMIITRSKTSMSIFDQIVLRIIKEQELVVGPLAWGEAKKIQGLKVIDTKNGQLKLTDGDPKVVVDRLVNQYGRLFGQASREVCKEAVTALVADMQPSEVPSSLK